MRKLLIGVVLAVAVAGAAYLYLKKENGAPTYRTAKVERGDIVDTITATGNINAVTTVSVGSQISGTIQKLFVDYNSRVRKDEVIAQIDPQLLKASVTQAQGSFENAKASLEKAKVSVADTERTYRRNRELLPNGFVAQSDVDAAQTAYDQAVAGQKSAEAVVTQAKGALEVVRTNLAYATIRSPVDGIIISRNVDVGQTVAASFQTPTLFSIAQDLTKMQIDTNVDEWDIGRAVKGQTVAFTVDAWPGKTFAGVVSQVRNAPIITQNVVTYDVVILVDNKELLLKPGMTTNVTIQVKKFPNILKIPNAAMRYRPVDKSKESAGGGARLKKEPLGQRIYTLGKDGKPVAVTVKTGVSDGSYTELLEGNLKEGDVVITGEATKGSSGSSASPPGMGIGRIR
ncbi:MAG: efflux RND transporter periplasmic adaptor subunit [Desulfobacteria bacterium]